MTTETATKIAQAEPGFDVQVAFEFTAGEAHAMQQAAKIALALRDIFGDCYPRIRVVPTGSPAQFKWRENGDGITGEQAMTGWVVGVDENGKPIIPADIGVYRREHNQSGD